MTVYCCILWDETYNFWKCKWRVNQDGCRDSVPLITQNISNNQKSPLPILFLGREDWNLHYEENTVCMNKPYTTFRSLILNYTSVFLVTLRHLSYTHLESLRFPVRLRKSKFDFQSLCQFYRLWIFKSFIVCPSQLRWFQSYWVLWQSSFTFVSFFCRDTLETKRIPWMIFTHQNRRYLKYLSQIESLTVLGYLWDLYRPPYYRRRQSKVVYLKKSR